MYSDDDFDERFTGVVISGLRSDNATASTTDASTNAYSSAVASPNPTVQDNALESVPLCECAECEDLPEAYLERCAVLIDLVPLFRVAEETQFEWLCTRTRPGLVESSYRILHYPAVPEECIVGPISTCLIEPFVNCTKMAPKTRKTLRDILIQRVFNVHSIVPRVSGLKWEAAISKQLLNHNAIFKNVSRQMRSTAWQRREDVVMCSVQSYTARQEDLSTLRNFFKTMVQRATQSPQRGGGATATSDSTNVPAIAFLTLSVYEDEVRYALRWAQEVLGVSFPKYRIFIFEETVGKDWAKLLEGVERPVELGAHCPYHVSSRHNQHSMHIRCSRVTVSLMQDVLLQAREYYSVYEEVRKWSMERGSPPDGHTKLIEGGGLADGLFKTRNPTMDYTTKY